MMLFLFTMFILNLKILKNYLIKIVLKYLIKSTMKRLEK